MSQSKVLYTKYRPHKLDDIVGQDFVKKCIKNAVKMNKISHAYLFTGTRGCGKTSFGRILSLIVNCENGPSIDYDLNSVICKSIINNRCPDVHEFDAATKTSIDDVRDIQTMSKNYPVMGKKRVFIIDECLPKESLIKIENNKFVNIKEIVYRKEIQYVLSYNFETKKIEKKKILRKIKIKNDKKMKKVKVKTKKGEYKIIKITENHNIFLSNGDKTKCKELKNKDKINILKTNIEECEIVEIEDIVCNDEYVYNLEIEDNHNYFADDFLVSNCHSWRGSAANSLLKTLEEPPSSCMFVLCTTEPEKILPTIKSRCQIFNLKFINKIKIKNRLEIICNHEKVKFEANCLELIAKCARGSMRDAISILDVIISSCGKDKITASAIKEYVQITGQEFFCNLLECIVKQSYKDAICLIRKSIIEGKDSKELLYFLIEQTHDMMLAKGVGSYSHLFLEKGSSEKWVKLYNEVSLKTLIFIMQKLNKYTEIINFSPRTDIVVDTCIVETIRELKE